MTLYQDETAVRDNAAQIAGNSAKRKSRKVWALAAVGTVFAGGAAFAAVQLFGFGSIDANASTLKELKVSNVRLTGTLAPGQSVGGAGDVVNENDFDVQVTGIVLQDTSLAGKGDKCDPATLVAGGTPVKVYPGAGGGTGHQIDLKEAVTLKAGQGLTIVVPGVVSQNSKATALCGVKANFAVLAAVGN